MIRFLNVYYPTRTVALLLSEALVVAGCFLLATWAMLGDQAVFVLQLQYGLLKIALITIVTLILSYYFDLYEPRIVSARSQIYFRVLLVLGVDCFILSAFLLLAPDVAIGSYVYVVGFALLAPALLALRRIYEWTCGLKCFRERVYVLGSGDYARSIVETIRTHHDIGMEVVAWEDLHHIEPVERKKIWIAALERIGKANPSIHRIIVAMEHRRGELPVQELLTLRFQGIDIEEDSRLRERLYGKIQLDGLRPSSFLYSEGFRIRPSQQITRQFVSLCAAALGLLLFLPIFPFVVLAVKLSSKGPLFFKQDRVGMGGRIFQVIKFRTMFTDAEAHGARWATKDDPRVTKIGSFLRKTRLDEVPQLWNVLLGDMALVGPRPERPEFVHWLTEELPFYYLRTLVRPGLTGWAQVRYGYGATLAETKEKLEYDLYYIKHMTLGLDLLIMFETIKTILRRRGAQ
jgi:sugar transferase (PEP-CTERM system associated)